MTGIPSAVTGTPSAITGTPSAAVVRCRNSQVAENARLLRENRKRKASGREKGGLSRKLALHDPAKTSGTVQGDTPNLGGVANSAGRDKSAEVISKPLVETVSVVGSPSNSPRQPFGFLSLPADQPLASIASSSVSLVGRELAYALVVPADVPLLRTQNIRGRGSSLYGHLAESLIWARALEEQAVGDLAQLHEVLNTQRQKITELDGANVRLNSRVTGLEGELKDAHDQFSEAQTAAHEMIDQRDALIVKLRAEVADANSRADMAEADYFLQGQDDRIIAAKEAGLDHTLILVDPEDDPTKPVSSQEEESHRGS